VAYSVFKRGEVRGPGGWKSPAGPRGKSLVGCFGDEVPQKLYHILFLLTSRMEIYA